ncbi:MAG: sigma-70 family RNA polymerase sigma factor [Clostridia bacterium]|nr:sigma-70 family RNA polymerase sigma factor [Clostridia bacterium]
MNDEERLLNGLKKRRRGSLEKAIDIYTPYVSVIIYNIIGGVMTKEDVEEAVADVFVSLWQNAGTLRSEKGSVRAYIAAIAKNCARKKLRSLRPSGELDENTADGGETPETAAELAEEQRLLIELIKDLGEPDSEIFLRHYWYGERVSEISSATGICKSTITTKLQRGRKKLKEILIQREVRQ